jgi:anaerobic dimethyl sulfoxide reductase subunit A
MTPETCKNDLDLTVVASGGCHDCGGRCPYLIHVMNGKALRIEPHEELKACVRGYGYLQRVYAPDRLRFPMKRVGQRGEGRFERISWEEALDSVAENLKRIRERYGPSAILCQGSSGSPGRFHNPAPIYRLFNKMGGCVYRWGSASAEGAYFAGRATFGTHAAGHTKDDLVNSHLIILWGLNPTENIWGTNTSFHLLKAKEKGVRIVSIDPRFTNTAALFADRWIPIRPCTDTAMMIAMAYVILKNDLHDKNFLETFTVGFDFFRDYLLGGEDGIEKTPAWAESITGVPSGVIEGLAIEYGTVKPAALIPSFAPGRTAFGEQFHRAGAALAAMTGNIGIPGGSPGCCDIPSIGVSPGPNMPSSPSLIPIGENPLEKTNGRTGHPLSFAFRSRHQVHNSKLWDSILEGKAGGYPGDIRFFYVVCANPLNQVPNANKGVKALLGLDFMVVQDQFMSATARYADILLPATTHWERDDYMRPWLGGDYHLFGNRAIEPVDEAKSDFEIARDLAKRLGIEGYSEKTAEEWLDEIVFSSADSKRDIGDYPHFRSEGVAMAKVKRPVIAFEDQIRDPGRFPFPTPSGKIEIFSRDMADLNDPRLPPIPKYIEPWEGPRDPLAATFPLQLITFHAKTRANSSFDNIEWLRQLEPHEIWINPVDAKPRDIGNNQTVRVFNERGELVIRAKVTQRIMPGVVAMGQGAWYSPDEQGIDRGGCANVLTRDEGGAGGATPTNTVLVQVARSSSTAT